MANDDPYKVLGVPENASSKDVTRAYRGLAKQLHPDTKPGDKKAEERFKQVASAYEVLGDESKRSMFDTERRLARKMDEADAERQRRAQEARQSTYSYTAPSARVATEGRAPHTAPVQQYMWVATPRPWKLMFTLVFFSCMSWWLIRYTGAANWLSDNLGTTQAPAITKWGYHLKFSSALLLSLGAAVVAAWKVPAFVAPKRNRDRLVYGGACGIIFGLIISAEFLPSVTSNLFMGVSIIAGSLVGYFWVSIKHNILKARSWAARRRAAFRRTVTQKRSAVWSRVRRAVRYLWSKVRGEKRDH